MSAPSEWDKMIAGDLYRPGDAELVSLRKTAQRLMRDYNATIYGEDAARNAILTDLLGTYTQAVIRPPFYVDYGKNIHLGAGVFFNYGCVVLDVCPVQIGAGTEIGPGVQILTADHPREASVRAEGLECGKPITIGAHVWIGGGALILPGVTIGDGAVIGAGAVVTRDVPAGATAVGNPARVR